ncbi:PucR family transcriptional regulator [Paenibacillus rigui]|uniref:PucR family transcriptional regulator n=1 Tax=Paenibacillus rigui TaxID=554312 RepID=A0A229UJN9_9BACL|nr:PucR family transcriptional regulator ligand-binding domain-containing protein [Paenibacillus rigui]OXM83630.1 PucR family transcriptional regulator [Paenibacillus rigui]
MDSAFILTVQDVLQRPLFAQACVLAGEGGLNRQVRWIHILEVSHFDKLVHGEEMILTTGISFQSDPAVGVSYVERLAAQNVSCLVIELGAYLNAVPEAMIEAAEKHQFPLIIFPGSVRFVDITQDVHSFIINSHHKTLQELERVSREFHRLTLTSQGTSNVLKLLHTSTKSQVIYLPTTGQAVGIPALPKTKQSLLVEFLQASLRRLEAEETDRFPYHLDYEEQTVIVQPAGALGKTWAYVAMVLARRPQEYDYLILDSATLSIAQDLLRKRYIDEQKLYTENLWVDDLLHSRLKDEEQLKSFMGTEFKRLNEGSLHVCLIEFEPSQEPAEEGQESMTAGIHLSMVLRPLLAQHSFYPLITIKNNRLVVVAIDLSVKRSGAKTRLQQVFDSLLLTHASEPFGGERLLIGVGIAYTGLMNAPVSYQEAIQALVLYTCFEKKVLFFDELGVFQLLFHIHDRTMLQAFVGSQLGPLIEYDQNKGGELLRTLQVYLDHDASKQVAAQKLFIVRQTLYYRLDKIAELLGEDYMSPDKRLALQVALRAYQLLNV